MVEIWLPAKYISSNLGGQDWVAAKRMLRNDKDVGSNPAPTRNKKQTLGDSPTEGSPMVQQGPSGRLGILNGDDHFVCDIKVLVGVNEYLNYDSFMVMAVDRCMHWLI